MDRGTRGGITDRSVCQLHRSRVHRSLDLLTQTAKAALAALTREMAADFAPRGIRVNAISRGRLTRQSYRAAPIVDIPMRWLGQPEEVAKAIYFLCTEQSSYINGAELSFDGGQRV